MMAGGSDRSPASVGATTTIMSNEARHSLTSSNTFASYLLLQTLPVWIAKRLRWSSGSVKNDRRFARKSARQQ